MTKNLGNEQLAATRQENGADLLDPAEFCRLLLSRKQLIRDSRPDASAVALIDPVSGKRYKVDGDRLDRFIERTAG